MIRKILGFLPVGFWLFMLYIGGTDIGNPMNTGWHISLVPWNVWVWFGLSVLSGILFCFRGMIPVGLMVGIIPNAYLFLYVFSEGVPTAVIVPGVHILFYVVYAVCYCTYNHELNKP